jgi:hypothetical protein
LYSVALLWAVFAAPATRGQAPNGSRAVRHNAVSGQYKLLGISDLGNGQVRATLLIRLSNHAESDLSIKSLELRGSHPAPRSTSALKSHAPALKSHAPAFASLRLTAHGVSTTKQEFTVSRAELELWKKGARPHLTITHQTGEAAATSTAVELTRAEGIRE